MQLSMLTENFLGVVVASIEGGGVRKNCSGTSWEQFFCRSYPTTKIMAYSVASDK